MKWLKNTFVNAENELKKENFLGVNYVELKFINKGKKKLIKKKDAKRNL